MVRNDVDIERWLKLYNFLRICGRASLLERNGESVSLALAMLSADPCFQFMHDTQTPAPTTDEVWQTVRRYFEETKASLALPLPKDARAEQSVLCWSLHVADGYSIDRIGHMLRRESEFLEVPWPAVDDKTVRERMWVATEVRAGKVTMSSLSGLMQIVDGVEQALGIRMDDLGISVPAQQPALDAEPEQRPIDGDESCFIADVTVPDGLVVEANASIEKIWEIQNAGSVPWRNRYLQRVGALHGVGVPKSPSRVRIADCEPGDNVRIAVPITAPAHAGSYRIYWKMTDESGALYFPNLTLGIWVDFTVEVAAPKTTKWIGMRPE